jgi:hypothetical protein
MTDRSPQFQDVPEGTGAEADRLKRIAMPGQALPRRHRTSLPPARPSPAGHRVNLETLQRVRAGLDRL